MAQIPAEMARWPAKMAAVHKWMRAKTEPDSKKSRGKRGNLGRIGADLRGHELLLEGLVAPYNISVPEFA
eukprot:3940741-Rhodomonas_salina.2